MNIVSKLHMPSRNLQGFGHLPPGLLGSDVQPDAPGMDVKDAECLPCSFDFSLGTRDAVMRVACAPSTRMRIRIKGRTCFLWNNIDAILVYLQKLCIKIEMPVRKPYRSI
jgi:hypothetical protein